MSQRHGIAAVLFLAAAAAAAVQAVRPALPVDAAADEAARFVAGLPCSSDPWQRLQETEEWKSFAAGLEKSWADLEAKRLAPMREWSGTELALANAETRTVFYPFGGPDLLTPLVLFPDADVYLLLGLEFVGRLPDFEKAVPESAGVYLADLSLALGDFLKKSYFITRNMDATLYGNKVDGVLPLLAFFLKAAIVPFHTWAPAAYEAATVPVTGFMSTVIKAGVLLAAVRLFGFNSLAGRMVELLAILSLVSIIWGNLAAIRQTSFRRMIAYSSIAHAGYLFYAFLGDGEGRFQAVAFYALVYGLMNLLAFAALPMAAVDAERDRLDNLKGLYQRAPFAALMIAVAMFSLAGIPPLPGFVAKFVIFRNVIEAGYTLYAVLGLVGSYLGIYFYLRVLQYMFMSPAPAGLPQQGSARLALGAIAVCLVPAVILTVYPGGLLGGL